MKKFFAFLMAGAAAMTANAQAVDSHKFLDNWSLGIYGGGVMPTVKNFDDTRSVAGLELTKKITPTIGLGLSSTAGFNTTGSYTAVDNVTTMLLGKTNLTNMFCGYNGRPRVFEIEGITGIGFTHYFGETDKYAVATGNTVTSKFGLAFNFNLGKAHAWTLSLRPAIVYDLEGGKQATTSQYNVNNSVLEMMAGITYNFKTSNGKHHFTKVRRYDASEVDGLNAKVNDLRAMVKDREHGLRHKDAEIRKLQQALNDCRSQKPIVQVERITNTRQTMESIITFRQGKSTVDASQLPNVERIATYLNNHKAATVLIKGYASPEGSAAINTKIAQERAEAVRNLLVKKYRIAPERITAEGQGIGDMFSEPDWNRVSICTLNEGE